MKKRLALVAIVLLVVMAGAGVFVYCVYFLPGVRVTLRNTGSAPMRSVVLYVTGQQYAMGDLAPGASMDVTVHPTTSSHLEIGFIDADGNSKRLYPGGYFGAEDVGTISVSVKDGVMVENDLHTRPYYFW
jgi:hypothetical protein